MNFFKGFCLTIFISLTAGAPLLMMYASWEWGGIQFLILTVLFALVLGALCAPIFRIPPRRPLVMRRILAAMFGALSGLFWYFLSGPDAHIPLDIRLCWIGAATGVTFIAYSSAGRSLKWIGMVALCAAVLTFGAVNHVAVEVRRSINPIATSFEPSKDDVTALLSETPGGVCVLQHAPRYVEVKKQAEMRAVSRLLTQYN